MTLRAPDWWALLLLSLAAFRLTRLVGWDDLTIKPRRWLTRMGDEEHKQWAYVVDHLDEAGMDAWTHVVPTSRAWTYPEDERWSSERVAALSREELRREWNASPKDSGLRAARLGGLAYGLEAATGSSEIPPLVGQEMWPPVGRGRFYLSRLVRCAWCAGFWISVGWWALWLWQPRLVLVAATPLAISAVLGLTAKALDS